MHGSRKLCQRGSNSTFLLDKGERIQIPLIIGPLAKRHFKWRFAGRPMLARHVMLAWYMFSFEIFYGIWTSIDKKKLYFCDFPGGGPDPLSPPLDPLMIRLLPLANWTVSILSHTEWWYKKHHLKTNIEMKQTANDKSQGERTIIVPSP